MIESFVSFFQSALLPFGGKGVFIASVIEEIIAPIPSTFVLLTSGAVLLPGSAEAIRVLFLSIVFPATAGITLGSFFVYGLSWRLGKPFIERFGKLLGLSWYEVEKVEKHLSRGPGQEIGLFLVRVIPIIPSVVISGAAGILRIPFRTYAIATFLGTIPRTIILAIVGWQAGEAYLSYANEINQYENIVLGGMVVIVLLFLTWRVYRKRPQFPMV